jgi:hypothetical protein
MHFIQFFFKQIWCIFCLLVSIIQYLSNIFVERNENQNKEGCNITITRHNTWTYVILHMICGILGEPFLFWISLEIPRWSFPLTVITHTVIFFGCFCSFKGCLPLNAFLWALQTSQPCSFNLSSLYASYYWKKETNKGTNDTLHHFLLFFLHWCNKIAFYP